MGEPDELSQAGYRVVQRIGKGGFGVVHLALDASERCVVIKQLHRRAALTQAFRARFLREIEALRRLRHPHIMPILAADAAASAPYFVMPHCPGTPLSVFRKLHPLSTLRVVGLLRDIASALVAVHDAGLIHRDVKPGNILITQEGTPVLFDFGLARAAQVVTPLTAQGELLGTPGYMAPEMFQGDDLGPAIDVYALGVTGAELLLRENPFLGDDLVECARRHLHEPPPRLDRLAPHRVPGALARLLERALDKVPARRPTARDLYDGLRRLHIAMSSAGRAQATEELQTVVRERRPAAS